MTEYKIRLPENLFEIVEEKRKREALDELSTLRLLVYDGAKDFVLDLYSRGESSLDRAAELLNTNPNEILRWALQRGIRVGPTLEQTKRSGATLKQLLPE